MSNLEDKLEEVARILGCCHEDCDEVNKAEALVGLFALVPKEFHLNLIEYILSLCISRGFPLHEKRLSKIPRVNHSKVYASLESEGGKEFKINFNDAWERKLPVEKLADAVWFSMSKNGNFVYCIAIFTHVLIVTEDPSGN